MSDLLEVYYGLDVHRNMVVTRMLIGDLWEEPQSRFGNIHIAV